MDVIPILGSSFNYYLPLALLIIALLTLFNAYDRFLQSVGVTRFEFDENYTDDRISEGHAIMRRERERVREEEGRGGGGGDSVSLLADYDKNDRAQSPTSTFPGMETSAFSQSGRGKNAKSTDEELLDVVEDTLMIDGKEREGEGGGEGGSESDVPNWGDKISSQITSWTSWAAGDSPNGEMSDHPSLSSDDISWLEVKEEGGRGGGGGDGEGEFSVFGGATAPASSFHSRVRIIRFFIHSFFYFNFLCNCMFVSYYFSYSDCILCSLPPHISCSRPTVELGIKSAAHQGRTMTCTHNGNEDYLG